MSNTLYSARLIKKVFWDTFNCSGNWETALNPHWMDFYERLTGNKYAVPIKCAADDCEKYILLYDRTIGRPKKYCSDRCRYRISQRKHRAKHN